MDDFSPAPPNRAAEVPSCTVIPLDIFLQAKAMFSGAKSKVLQQFRSAYDELRAKHSCLSTSANAKFPHTAKSTHNAQAMHSRRTMEQRPRIGVRELSREDMVCKDILSHLNKLSKTNVESIIRSLRTSFYLDYLQHYISITWDMMYKQPDFQPLFVMVLNNVRALLVTPVSLAEFDALLTKNCCTYLDEQGWIPPPAILCPTADYDDFCDYVKWKKKSQGMLKAVLTLMTSHLIEPRFEDVFERISDSLQLCADVPDVDLRILECILDALLICVRSTKCIDVSDEWLQQWMDKSQTWPKNAKFKMLDLQEGLRA